MEGMVFLKKGESLFDEDGDLLFVANKDLRVCDAIHHTDVILPNGQHPDKHDEISPEIMDAVLTKYCGLIEERKESEQ